MTQQLTTKFQLPYYQGTDLADGATQQQALADRLEVVLAQPPTAPWSSAPVLDVGLAGQIRAGRQLALADFTSLGLSAPAGLWNLSDLSDVSGNARALTNKGTVPFGVGINGLATTAAQFAGSTAQALYRADTGAADPFRIATGSWGCWFRTAKRAAFQLLVSKFGVAPNYAWELRVNNANVAEGGISTTGSNELLVTGVTDVCDDRWHFAVVTSDGTTQRLYVDGVLEGVAPGGVIGGGASPLNIGGSGADASLAASNPHYGRVDEAFVTADVLSDDQVRLLYCAKVAHGYFTTPTRLSLNVIRRKRGGVLATTDFPTQPLRLHNFTAGALTDQGSGAVALVNNGAAVSVIGADGASGGAFSFAGAQSLSSTDAGLPAALTARSYGCWVKTGSTVASTFLAWPGASLSSANGLQTHWSGADQIVGPFTADGQWHFVVGVEDNVAGDGVRRKLYVDGRAVGGSTVMNSITLAGANRFRVGAASDGTVPFTGQIDGAFVCGYALTFEQIAALYAKGSQALAVSPKNSGDHVESLDATNVLATFDSLGPQHSISLGVTA
jgi:hypothetical protein